MDSHSSPLACAVAIFGLFSEHFLRQPGRFMNSGDSGEFVKHGRKLLESLWNGTIREDSCIEDFISVYACLVGYAGKEDSHTSEVCCTNSRFCNCSLEANHGQHLNCIILRALKL